MTFILVALDVPDRNSNQSVDCFWIRRRPVDDETANAWHRAHGMEPGELIVAGSCGRYNVSKRITELTMQGHLVHVMDRAPTFSDFPEEEWRQKHEYQAEPVRD